MKTTPASACAMAAGWAAGLVAWIGRAGIQDGMFDDVGFVAIWSAAFMFVAWVILVLPLLARWEDAAWLSSPKWSWLGWCVLAMSSYALLVGSIFGRDALSLLWHPAVAGCVAGIVFAVLRRERPNNDV